ncbi:MAG: hypothetical protein IPM94_13415 [bacterium]|nr:hypothetical protein [bacterium]
MPRIEVVIKSTTISNVNEISFTADRAFDPHSRKCGAEPNIDFVRISRSFAEPVADGNSLWAQMKQKEELFKVTIKFFEVDKVTKDHFRMISLENARIINCSLSASTHAPALNETIELAVDKVVFSGPGMDEVEISLPPRK